MVLKILICNKQMRIIIKKNKLILRMNDLDHLKKIK